MHRASLYNISKLRAQITIYYTVILKIKQFIKKLNYNPSWLLGTITQLESYVYSYTAGGPPQVLGQMPFGINFGGQVHTSQLILLEFHKNLGASVPDPMSMQQRELLGQVWGGNPVYAYTLVNGNFGKFLEKILKSNKKICKKN